MARGEGAVAMPVQPGVVERVAGAIRGAARGAWDGWFGPGQPTLPSAPPDTRGRAFDFGVGANLSTLPRGEVGENAIDFPTLRALADPASGGFDLLRLAIETRKDQMAGQAIRVQARNGAGDGGARAREVEARLRYPDDEHDYLTWQRLILEDLLVLDAPAVYLAPGGQNGTKVPEVIDGATIKRLLHTDGRTPRPPLPAYSQVLKGVSAAHYTRSELIYAPRNPRPNKVYGQSPVEQVLLTVQIALRRQLSQLEFYTAGSMPDLIVGVPEAWGPDQIKQFQTWWDSILAGNTEARRRARFVPGGLNVTPLKPDGLKDEFDEWLARIIAFAFSLSPQPLVREVNRATAETAKEAALEEGLEPLKLWWKHSILDRVIADAFNAPDLEAVFEDEEISDPAAKANVWTTLAGKRPIITLDEAREAYGLPPLREEQRAELAPPAPPAFGQAPGAAARAGAPDAGGGVGARGGTTKLDVARFPRRRVTFRRGPGGEILDAVIE